MIRNLIYYFNYFLLINVFIKNAKVAKLVQIFNMTLFTTHDYKIKKLDFWDKYEKSFALAFLYKID